MLRKIALPVITVAAVAGVLAATGPGAHADVNSGRVTYTTAGASAAAGWSVRSAAVDFTHTQGRYGSAGNSSWENLPVSTLGTVTAGEDITALAHAGGINGGIAQELCDTAQGAPGYAAQEVIVQVAKGQFAVIETIGAFGKDAANGTDVCDNGVLGAAAGSTVTEAKVLLAGIKANDTVDMNTLYNARTHYSVNFDGGNRNVEKGHVTFAAENLKSGAIGFDDSIAGAFITSSFITDEAAQLVTADTAQAQVLTGTSVPAPNGGVLEGNAPHELFRAAHSIVSGNAIDGSGTSHGSYFTSPGWTATPVASSADGTKGGALYLVPSAVRADNFYVAGGDGIVG